MHIYGFQRVEVEHILSTFHTLGNTEWKALGEYRTMRLVLDSYDRMATAAATGGGWCTAAGQAAARGPRHTPRDHPGIRLPEGPRAAEVSV